MCIRDRLCGTIRAKRHLDRFSRFCSDYPHYAHRHRHPDHATPSVAIRRIRLIVSSNVSRVAHFDYCIPVMYQVLCLRVQVQVQVLKPQVQVQVQVQVPKPLVQVRVQVLCFHCKYIPSMQLPM